MDPHGYAILRRCILRLGTATLTRRRRSRCGYCLQYNRDIGERHQQGDFSCRREGAPGSSGLDLEQALPDECITDDVTVNGGARIVARRYVWWAVQCE